MYEHDDIRHKTGGISVTKISLVVISFVTLIVLMFCSTRIVEYVEAGYLTVAQNIVGTSDDLEWWDGGGLHAQWFRPVTTYKRSFQYWFSSSKDQGNARDQSIRVTFKDRGTGFISGSIRVDLPTDREHLNKIHKKFGSQAAIEHELIRPIIEKAVLMSGPLMTSKESSAEKRSMLLNFIEDQATNGVYKTYTKDTKEKDPLTGGERVVTSVELVLDEKMPNGIGRVEASPIHEYGITLSSLSINLIEYDKAVKDQIAQQQDLEMQIQTSMVQAKQAEQRKLTVEQEGAANAAKARWEQETIAAAAVAKANQEKTVAETEAAKNKNVAVTKAEADKLASELAVQTAENYKREKVLRGEGEARYKELVMKADGALEQKLKAIVDMNNAWAVNVGKQPLVPQMVFGGTEKGIPNSLGLVEMLMAKTAKDLSVDLSTKSN